MEAQDFCYWLQGWFELNKTIDHREGASPTTIKMIEEHLQLVFNKVTSEPVQEKVEYPTPMPTFPPTPVWPNVDDFFKQPKRDDFLSRPTIIC
ncbi:MAG: hypothetical protein ACXABJ_11125 [Candidatus Heimdallarchaeaceae archaeon]|jgi:hypothetical protein